METWFWILGWFLSILTITGNGFIMFLVSSKRRLRTKTNAFIVSLAVADFFVGMCVVPSLFFCDITSSCEWPQPWHSWADIIRWLFSSSSVINLCCLVLDRYIAIVKPLKYVTFMTSHRVLQITFFSWVTTFVIVLVKVSLRASLKTSLISYSFGWLCIFMFEFLPCLLLIFCFASMLHFVLKHDRSTRNLAKQLRFNHQGLFKIHHEKSAVIMMAIVIGMFLVCYGIYLHCSYAVVVLKNQDSCNDHKYKVPLLLLNSVVNPFAYAFLKRDIKKEFKRLICIVILKKNKANLIDLLL